MSEKLVEPKDYTPEIKASILKIKSRMRNTLVSFTEDDIKVFEYEGVAYVLANPVLRYELDECGNPDENKPIHNITAIVGEYSMGTRKTKDAIEFTISTPKPKLIILRPDLCDRIEL